MHPACAPLCALLKSLLPGKPLRLGMRNPAPVLLTGSCISDILCLGHRRLKQMILLWCLILQKSLPSQEYIWCMTSLAWKKRRSFSNLWMKGHGKVYLKEGFSIMGGLPSFVSNILQKIHSFPGLDDTSTKVMDQLTVNEYPPGVGLSPHIDTHSAFDDLIFSLSLAGPCIMEFRKYNEGNWNPQSSSVTGREELTECAELSSNVTRKAVFLSPRSMLLMSGEGRYAWHHYIPHHKVDMVGGHAVKRGSRRVSFTFRKVRKGPCQCIYQKFCDSQLGSENDARRMSSDTH